MRRARCSASLVACALSLAAPLAAQSADELTAGGLFLLLPVGARAVATGQAAVADHRTSESVFWNPAGLATVVEKEFAVHHYSVLAGSGDALVALIPSGLLGVFGLTLYQLDYGAIDVTASGDGSPIGRIDARNLAFIASYGTEFPVGVDFGLNFKIVQTRTDCSGSCAGVPTATGTTHAVDIGAQRAFANGHLRLGVAVTNVGLKLQVENRAQADPLPTRVRLGGVYRVVLERRVDQHRDLDVRLLVDLDDEWASYGDPDARIGADAGVGELVRLRVGYAFTKSATRGIGLGVGFRVRNLALDIARTVLTSNELGEEGPGQISFRLLF